MQANYNPINIQHKCSVIIKKPKYIMNDGWSWIIAAVENGKLDENSTEQDIFNLKVELARENKIRLNQFLRSANNKKGVLFDPCDYCLDIPYYIIGDNINKINGTSGRNYISNDLYSGNDRILNCNVSQDIGSSGQCNITLDNTGDIYTLHNEFYYNSESINLNYGEYTLNQNNICVIEPNDEVEVYMSDWQGNFNCVFTGYVSNVSFSDDGLQKRISLQCDDITKKLNWIYFNAQAGFDVREARGVKLSAYTENQQPLKLNEVVSNVLAETYCDIYKRDDFLLKLVKVYANAWKWQKKSNLTTANLNSAYYRMRQLIMEEIKEYVEIENAIKEVEVFKQVQFVKTNLEEGRIGRKCSINYKKLLNEDFANSKKYIQTPFLDYKEGDIAFKISGTDQPFWAWTTHNGAYDYLFSNYKKSLDFIKEIANIVQYEFFADNLGLVLFRPPNLTMPRLSFFNKDITEYYSINTEDYNNFIKNNYWITKDKEQFFSNFNSTINDNKIFTRVNVIGHNIAMNFTHGYLKSACYTSQWYLNKYGLRMMPTATKVGLLDDNACKSYGELLLWKNNINYELCSASCILNSNYHIGLPIYIEKYLAVWYIGRVTHNFNSGGNCTTELTLTYKRTPMCLKRDLPMYLSDNLAWGKLTQTEYNYIQKYENILTWDKLITPMSKYAKGTTSELTDFIWQPIPTQLYQLTIELQEQINLVNNIKNNKKKTIVVNRIKRKKKIASKYGVKDLQGKTVIDIANEDPNMLTPDQVNIQYAYIKAEQEYRQWQEQTGKEILTWTIIKPYKLAQEIMSPYAEKFGELVYTNVVGPYVNAEREFDFSVQEERTKTALERTKNKK